MSSAESPSIILGIDPGLNTTGYGLLRAASGQLQLIEAGVIRSKKSHTLEERLKSIYQGAVEVIEAFKPNSMAMEELYSHYERPMPAIIMGHARGVLCLAAAQSGVPVWHYRATQIKSTMTGNGRAPKDQVQFAVMNLLKLEAVPEPPDVADALAIGICHYYLTRNLMLQK